VEQKNVEGSSVASISPRAKQFMPTFAWHRGMPPTGNVHFASQEAKSESMLASEKLLPQPMRGVLR
jgi:hypothetical protein